MNDRIFFVMVRVIVTLDDFQDRIVSIVKSRHGLRSRAAAISYLIQDSADDYLELKPSFIKKLERARTSKHLHFKNVEELRKHIEKC